MVLDKDKKSRLMVKNNFFLHKEVIDFFHQNIELLQLKTIISS